VACFSRQAEENCFRGQAIVPAMRGTRFVLDITGVTQSPGVRAAAITAGSQAGYVPPPTKPALVRTSCASAPVSSSISISAVPALAAWVVMAAVYIVLSAHSGGSGADNTMPFVAMISVDCVQPIG